LLFIIVLFGLAYFLFMRSRSRNRAGGARGGQSGPEPGDKVMLKHGLYGTFVRNDGDDLIIETAPGVEHRYHKGALGRVIPEPVDDDEPDTDPDDHDDLPGSDLDDGHEGPDAPAGGATDPLEEAFQAPSATRPDPVPTAGDPAAQPPAAPDGEPMEPQAPAAAEPPAPPEAPEPPSPPAG
jgi:preprotein translocase subunit YajC